MQDQRSIITQKICMTLIQHDADQELIDAVRSQLEIELAKCEVYERCTSVTVVDNSPYQYLQQYLNMKRIEGKSAKTVERYKYEINRLLWFCNKPLNEITANDIRLYLDHKKYSGKKELSNRTLNNMRQVFSPFFAWLAYEDIIPKNPCIAVHQIKYRKSVRTMYSPTDLQKLREACNCIRDTAMIDWLSSTGCRVEEVATTQLSMINWNERSCIVIGKGNKERKVFFDAVTAMHVQMYLNTRKDVVDALFIGRGGKPLTKAGIQRAVKRIGERAGVMKVYCHRFRHTLASNLATKMPVAEVAAILGHDSIATTQVYVHSDPAAIAADYRRVMA
jgi:site-specific recombinase XerD